MRVPRLYLPVEFREGAVLVLPEERAHYLKSVLRMRLGAELVVFDGKGIECDAYVDLLSRDESRIRLVTRRERSTESPLFLHLGLGVSRGERMDWVIQKAVELGVTRISPLISERTVVRLDGERREARWQHWKRVAQSACEQCHRNYMPEIDPPLDLETWADEVRGMRLLLDPRASSGIDEVIPDEEGVVLLSGPEGGFSAEERAKASASGFRLVRFGPRILRAETAAVAALTAAQLIWGDLRS